MPDLLGQRHSKHPQSSAIRWVTSDGLLNPAADCLRRIRFAYLSRLKRVNRDTDAIIDCLVSSRGCGMIGLSSILAKIVFPSGFQRIPNGLHKIVVRGGQKEGSCHWQTSDLVSLLSPVGMHDHSAVCARGAIPP